MIRDITIRTILSRRFFSAPTGPQSEIYRNFSVPDLVVCGGFFLGICSGYLFSGRHHLLSKVPVKFMVKGLKPLFIILLITVAFNLFLIPGKEVWSLGFLTITVEGIQQAVKIGIRLIYLVMDLLL